MRDFDEGWESTEPAPLGMFPVRPVGAERAVQAYRKADGLDRAIYTVEATV